MDTQPGSEFEEPTNAETPEDVAVLFAWANLHGAKYRDYSASRREYRAQVRHRAAEDLRRAELQAQAEAERAAAEAERAAQEAERVARSTDRYSAEGTREEALRAADEAARIAAAERVEAARRAEAAAAAEMAARREEREIAEAHASAQRQAARYADSEIRRRSLAGPQPAPVLIPGLASDPYVQTQGSGPDVDLYSPNTQLETVQPRRFRGDDTGGAGLAELEAGLNRTAEGDLRRRPQGYRPDEASGVRPGYRANETFGQAQEPAPVRSRIHAAPFANQAGQDADRAPSLVPASTQRVDPFAPATPSAVVAAPYVEIPRGPLQEPAVESDRLGDHPEVPAWILETPAARPALHLEPQLTAGPASTPAGDTLLRSRERVATRWYALKNSSEPGQDANGEPVVSAGAPDVQQHPPVLAIFSLAGGVGKTSLVATLGRAFSSKGEKVLLVDTTSHGLLPFYFGASELKPGVVRTFSPPSDSSDAAIHLVSYDTDHLTGEQEQKALTEDLLRDGAGTRRLLLDLNRTSAWLIQELVGSGVTILVPVAPDMNSVISLQGVERFFEGLTDAEGQPIRPYYLINQYDASLPLHQDVREVLRRQLGERLLPLTIRRSPAVSEALAEGMTLVDYAADSPAADDYMKVANWIQTVSTPTTQDASSSNRWSER